MTDRSQGQGMFEGLKVVEFTTMMAGPLATRYLADLGAEVIKVEAPGGDYMRTRHPLRDGSSAYYAHINAGKKSIVLDLKDPKDQDIARKLIAWSDVTVENLKPGVMTRFNLGYEHVRKDNPGLIYCSISGYGVSGPGAKRPAYAQIIQAASGYDLAFTSYQPITDRPPNTMFFTADVMGAGYAFSGILAALYQRQATGLGQYVDVTLLESIFQLMVYEIQHAQFPTTEKRPIFYPLKTRDGHIMLAPTTTSNFESVAMVVGHPEWIGDARFAKAIDRNRNWSSLYALIEEWTSQRSSEECERLLGQGGVPCSQYRTVEEALADEQVALLGTLSPTTDRAGELRVPNLPFRLSASKVNVQPFVADLDEHRAEILEAIAGTSAAPDAVARQ